MRRYIIDALKRYKLWQRGEFFIRACSVGAHDVVNLLLHSFPRRLPGNPVKYDKGLYASAVNGHAEIVLKLLQDGRADPSPFGGQVFTKVALKGDINIARILFQDRRVRDSIRINDLMYRVCCEGHVAVVRLLLKDPKADPTYRDYMAPKRAFYNQDSDMLRLFADDPRGDGAIKNRLVILNAIITNDIETALQYLAHPHTDCSLWDNGLACAAAQRGNYEVLDYILFHNLIIPSGFDNILVRIAAGSDIRIFKRVLQEDVDPSAHYNSAIDTAIRTGHGKNVRILLSQYPKVDPKWSFNAFLEACEKGYVDAVDAVLKDGRMDPTVKNNLATTAAARRGRNDVVKRLQQDERVQLSLYGKRL